MLILHLLKKINENRVKVVVVQSIDLRDDVIEGSMIIFPEFRSCISLRIEVAVVIGVMVGICVGWR